MVDISKLPEPKFIEIDADKVTDEIVALYEQLSGKTLYPAQSDRLMIDVIAYREMLIRSSINEAAKQNLLSFAKGVMLDYLGDFFGVERLDDESDEQLRTRIRLAPESYATTGSRQAYIYHALSTDASIIDAQATRGPDGNIYLYILTADAEPSDELLKAVYDNTSEEKKRPLSDCVNVRKAMAVDVQLVVKVHPLTQSIYSNVLKQAENTLDSYVQDMTTKLGQDVVPSQIIDRLSTEHIWQIQVISPNEPVILEAHQVPNFTTISVTLGDAEYG